MPSPARRAILGERVVRLLAGVDGEPGRQGRDSSLCPSRKAMRQRCQDRGQVCFGAAAREGHGGVGRHADEGRQRPQRVALHLDGARGMGVDGELRIVGGHERVGGHRHLAHAGIEEAQVARVRHLHGAALEQTGGGIKRLVRRHGPREVERALDFGAHVGRVRFAAHGSPRHAARKVVDLAEEGAPERGRSCLSHCGRVRADPEDVTELAGTHGDEVKRIGLIRRRPFASPFFTDGRFFVAANQVDASLLSVVVLARTRASNGRKCRGEEARRALWVERDCRHGRCVDPPRRGRSPERLVELMIVVHAIGEGRRTRAWCSSLGRGGPSPCRPARARGCARIHAWSPLDGEYRCRRRSRVSRLSGRRGRGRARRESVA